MLVRDIADIKKHIAISSNTTFDKVKPYIESAERDFFIKLIGAEQYKELDDAYSAPEGKLSYLLNISQNAVCNLAFFRGFSFLSVKISDQGFQRVEGEKFKSLYMNQERNLKETFKSDGFNGLDQVLEYLEENIDDFAKFKASSNYTVIKASLIPNTKTFDGIYDINNSRLVFLKLRRFLTEAEDLDLLPVIGAPLLSRIKTELAKETPDPKIKAILKAVQKPLPYLAIARGIKQLRVNVTDNGVFFESKDKTNNDGKMLNTIPDNFALVLAEDAQNTGNQYMEILKSTLAAAAEDYPEYIGSSSAVVRRNNSDKRTVWV